MICDLLSLYWGGRWYIHAADDDAIYYMRQIDAADSPVLEGIEALVWYGQTLEDAPEAANVFVGRRDPTPRYDADGNPICRWVGLLFPVPKGRICADRGMTLETVVFTDYTGLCSFPQLFIRALGWIAPPTLWNVEEARSCGWPDATGVPDAVRAAMARLGGLPRAVDALPSARVSPGYAGTSISDLSGLWVGDDGGSYYLHDVRGASDLVWYAESPDARPGAGATPSLPAVPAQGFANVFAGERSGDRITGFWADVPRGATRGAGRMELGVRSPQFMEIVRVTGGYRARRLWRVEALEVSVWLGYFTLVSPQEHSGDEILLYLNFFKIDGDTVDLDAMSSSMATVQAAPHEPFLRGGLGFGSVVVPESIGRFDTTLTTIRSRERDTRADTRIGVQAFVIERDSSSPDFRRRRYRAWVDRQQSWLNREIQRGSIPSLTYLREGAGGILTHYRLFVDTDDTIAGDVAMASFDELQDAARASASPLGGRVGRNLTFRGEGGSYTLHVGFHVRARLNRDCM